MELASKVNLAVNSAHIMNSGNGADLKEVAERSNTVLLSDVPTVKAFFEQNKLVYDEKSTRAENLLANFNRLPVDTDCTYVISDISFEVEEGQEYNFPSNYRAKDVRVYGGGSLSFFGNVPELNGSAVIRTETKLKSVLGVYYPDRSIVWNILNAEEVGHWPSSDPIILRGMCLNISEEEVDSIIPSNCNSVELPENIEMDSCYITDTSDHLLLVTNGHLMLTGEKAHAIAIGSAAKLDISAGKGWVCNSAEGFAEGTGTVIGLDGGCRIWADGPNAKAIGLDGDVFMSISNGGLGIKHVVTVNAVKDHHPNSRIRMSAVHRKLPDELITSTLEFNDGKNQEHAETILELKYLADLKVEKAACMLATVNTHNFNAVVKMGEQRIKYLKMAAESDDIEVEREARKQIVLYYCQQYHYAFRYAKADYTLQDELNVRPKAEKHYNYYCQTIDGAMPKFSDFEKENVARY